MSQYFRRLSSVSLFAVTLSFGSMSSFGQDMTAPTSEVTQVCHWWHFGTQKCCRSNAAYNNIVGSPSNLSSPGTSSDLTSPGNLSTPSDLSSPGTSSAPGENLLGAQVGALPSDTLALADTNGGYIDSAIPRTRLRMRFDAAFDNNRPDRAEYFYAKCGCFRNPALGGAFDPDAEGPTTRDFRPETNLDYQDVAAQLEVAWNSWISGFIEFPFRFLNPVVNDNTSGFADMNVGFKIALVSSCDEYLTFQLRTYIPTGDSRSGLGTDHVSIEPAILYYKQLSSCLQFEAELRDWISIDGSDFAGNVLQYGAGMSYKMYEDGCGFSISPVIELVGWTVLDGMAFNGAVIEDSEGDTIVNVKIGTRVQLSNQSSIYAGYGTALTDEVWYDDIIRLEYRMNF